MICRPEDDWSEEDYDMLQARTGALRAPRTAAVPASQIPVVYVSVESTRFALPGRSVLATMSDRRPAVVPHAPPELAGIVEWRGFIVPVFYLHVLFGLTKTNLGVPRLVLLGAHEPEFAFAVDYFEEFSVLDKSTLSEPPESLSAWTRSVISGLDARGALVLDDRALLSSDKLIVDIRTSFEMESRT